MTAGSAQPIVARADLVRFLVAFGLVPLLLARIDFADPPWSFVLAPDWSPGQLVFMTVAGGAIGFTSGRPAHGLAAVMLGVLVGVAVDLWWFANQVTPYDQDFVTMLARDAWWSRMVASVIALCAAVAAGFVVGAILRQLIHRRAGDPIGRPAGSTTAAIGMTVVGSALFALGIASAAASSPLVVPDGAQVQTVSVLAGEIVLSPATLRSGPTHFMCRYAPESTSEWTRLVAAPEVVDVDTVLASIEDISTCGPQPGHEMWGSIAELPPGRFLWIQVEPLEIPRLISTSPVFVVEP